MQPAVSDARLVVSMPAHLTRFSDELAVAIDDEDALGVCVPNELLDDGQDLAIILVVHHQLRVIHRQLPR